MDIQFVILIFLFVFLFLVFLSINIVKWKRKKYIIKILRRYFIISIIVILFFSFFYMMVFLGDLQEIRKQQNTEITTEMLKNLPSIRGLDLEKHKGEFNYSSFILYSSSVYFHYNSSIQIQGIAQIIVSVERFFSIIIPLLIVVISTLKKDEDDTKKILFALLNRGYSFLRIRNIEYIGNLKVVELINQETEIIPVYLKDYPEIMETMKYFKINWSKSSIELAPYFTKILEEPLRHSEGDYARNALLFFINRDQLNEEYLIEYYQFLQEVRYLKVIYQSEIEDENFADILKLLHENINDKSRINLDNKDNNGVTKYD